MNLVGWLEAARQHKDAFSDMLTFWPARFNLSTGGRSRYVEGPLVSSNYLDVLGVKALILSPMASYISKLYVKLNR